MTDFCKQCSIEMFNKDYRDLAYTGAMYHPSHHVRPMLCETCGVIYVNQEGECMDRWCNYHQRKWFDYLEHQLTRQKFILNKIHDEVINEIHKSYLAANYVKGKGFKRYKLITIKTGLNCLNTFSPIKAWMMFCDLRELGYNLRVHIYYAGNPLIDSGLYSDLHFNRKPL